MADAPEYVPPKVWAWTKPSGGRFASINRPVAGPTHEKELPVGRHPLQLYSLATPNGIKVTILLEELLALGHAGAEYDAWLIDINEGDQFGSGFVAVNPNSKIPALVDRSGKKPIRVFELGAILLYLAEKFDAFAPKEGAARAECLSWLFWQMGSGPFIGGGFGHFYAYAPTKIEYAIDRYAMETKRLLDVLDRRLAEFRICRGRRLYRCGYGHLPLVRRAGEGLELRFGRVPQRAGLQERPALGRPRLGAAGGAARAHGQPDLRRPVEAAPRAPRGERLRDQDGRQARGGGVNPQGSPGAAADAYARGKRRTRPALSLWARRLKSLLRKRRTWVRDSSWERSRCRGGQTSLEAQRLRCRLSMP